MNERGRCGKEKERFELTTRGRDRGRERVRVRECVRESERESR